MLWWVHQPVKLFVFLARTIFNTTTGFGKTVVMEMAICRLFQQSSLANKATPKILYLAPNNQIVTKKMQQWQR